MKVVRLHGPGDVRLHDEPVPVPGCEEPLVRVTAAGLCGSDLHWFVHAGIGTDSLETPLILGHEAAGVTEGGQQVAIDPSIPCGRCEACREGNPNLCPYIPFAGHGLQDGTLREMLEWPARCLVPLPSSLSDADGAMLEPLGIELHGADLGKLRSGMRVGVFGCGPIGLLVLQLARVSGATQVLFTEPLAHRRDAARRLGGKEWTSGTVVDVAFEGAGATQAVEDATEAARPGGRVVLVGIPDDDRTSFAASVARRKGLTIKLSRRMKHAYPRALSLVESGAIDVRSLVTHRFRLEQAVEALAAAQQRAGLRIMIDVA